LPLFCDGGSPTFACAAQVSHALAGFGAL